MANISTFTPDNFAGDWYGWVTNQSGHALFVGVGGFMVAYAVTRRSLPSVAIVAVLYAMWEVHHVILTGDWFDSLTDWAFVMSGACLAWSMWAGRAGAAYIIAGLIAVASAIGIARRTDGK